MWVQVIAVIEGFFLLAAATALATNRTKWIFATGFNVMAPVIALFLWEAPGGHLRPAIGAAMAGLYLLDLNWTILVWTGDTAMGKLDATTTRFGKVGLAFVLAHSVGLGYALPFYFVGRDTAPLGLSAVLAVVVYAVGTVFHIGGDLQKRRFKRQPDSHGRLLETGFWSLCRHPNYFGDFLIYTSFALLARHPLAWIAPALNLLQYLFDAIPKNEQWAAGKYGSAWAAYRASTPMFLPLGFVPRR